MSPESQRIAIAEAVGGSDLTDYPGDMNAMREAEKTLSALQRGLYRDSLVDAAGDSYACFADARTRAEHFLRTVGKWDDSK